jgi:cystathionine gamma-synthase/methionine-gamma-lyase
MDGQTMTESDESTRPQGFATRAVHAGERPPRPEFVPTTTPIYLSNSFSYPEADTSEAVFAGERGGYVYTRYGNPTIQALETAIAELEGAEEAVIFSSGMAAIHTAVLNSVRAGSKIVAAKQLYGASASVLTTVFASLGIETVFVDLYDLEEVERVVLEVKPRVLYFESIANPLVQVADIRRLVAIAKQVRATTIVDNTFASPVLINPLKLGVDIVVHSSTKYLSGHGDVTGGAIATDFERAYEIREMVKLTGGISGPFEAWLTLRGIKTLPLRMKRQSDNACLVANWLSRHPKVSKVHYPGLVDLGDVSQQFNSSDRGGMLSFEIAGAAQREAHRFLDAVKVCVPATTLGDVYSLVLYPLMSTHRGLEPDEQRATGITAGLLRLSVGIEDPADIIADLDQALNATFS